MKLESLKKFQESKLNKNALICVVGGKLHEGGTAGGSVCAADISTDSAGTCVYYTSDYCDEHGGTTYYGTTDSGDPC